MTHLLQLVRTESAGVRREILVTTAVSGIANAAIIAIIAQASQSAGYDDVQLRYLLMFIVAMVLYIMCLRYSSKKMIRIMTQLVQKLRVRLVDKLQAAELPVVEKVGKSPILNALTHESTTIADSGEAMIEGLQSIIFVCFGFAYVAYLSRPAFYLSVVSAIVALTLVFRARSQALQLMQKTRDRELVFLNYATDVLEGFKEARLNQKKSDDLRDDVHEVAERVTELREEIEDLQTRRTIMGRASFYILIAMVVFLLPVIIETYTEVIAETVTAILFVVGPLSMIVGIVPYLTRSNESARSILELEAALDQMSGETPRIKATKAGSRPRGFRSIEVDRASYRYGDTEESFSLGPLSFDLNEGEILFLTGGNGSGKSTLLKLVAGLYPLDSGKIRIDGDVLESGNIQSYREMFSAVFSDFHLFRKLYNLLDSDEALVNAMLERMQISRKVRFEDEGFSTLELSTGQRKRLALAVSLLEDRPILIFDELAADQDPEFREFLYKELLPELQRAGRTIIAATHDDRYFNVADRVIRMEYGTIEYIRERDQA